MRKVLFSIGVFNDYRKEIFNNQIRNRNAIYCNYHGFEYLHIDDIPIYRDHYSWSRLKMAMDIIETMDDGDILANLDADMCIVDGRYKFETTKSFGYSIDNGNSHCLGSWTLRVNEWSIKMIKNLLSEDLYFKYKNDGFVKMWKEQALFYYLVGLDIPRADNPNHYIPYFNRPNFGFNEVRHPETIYETKELIDNVEIFSSDWNVVYRPGDRFYICPSKETIIRHWAGSQNWEKSLYEDPIKF